MPHKIKCFVSFSTVDANQRDIEFFLSQLRGRLEQKVDFRVYFEQKVGADLQQFMLHDLASADAIILLFTPDYKKKADNAVQSGALSEFMRVVDLLEDPKKRDQFLCIPILWRGANHSAALPEYFLDRHRTIDLSKFRAYGADDRPPYLPKSIETELRGPLSEISDALDVHWQRFDPAQIELDRIVDKKLLEDPTIEGVVVTDPTSPEDRKASATISL